jgi:hypothetical protein
VPFCALQFHGRALGNEAVAGRRDSWRLGAAFWVALGWFGTIGCRCRVCHDDPTEVKMEIKFMSIQCSALFPWGCIQFTT